MSAEYLSNLFSTGINAAAILVPGATLLLTSLCAAVGLLNRNETVAASSPVTEHTLSLHTRSEIEMESITHLMRAA